MTDEQLTELETKNLKKLHNFVNIIPILCFGDYYKKKEIKKIKNGIRKNHLFKQINWFDCMKALENFP